MPLEATALVMQKHPIETSSLTVFVCHQVTGFFMPPELVAPFFPTKCGLWYLLWHRSSVKAIYIKSKWCFEDGTWGTSASRSFIILSPAVDEAWCYKGGKENPIKHLLNSFRVFFFSVLAMEKMSLYCSLLALEQSQLRSTACCASKTVNMCPASASKRAQSRDDEKWAQKGEIIYPGHSVSWTLFSLIQWQAPHWTPLPMSSLTAVVKGSHPRLKHTLHWSASVLGTERSYVGTGVLSYLSSLQDALIL